MKLSLGAILAIWLAGLQFVAVLSVVFFYYISSERVLFDHANTLIGEVAQSSVEHSKGFLEPALGASRLAKRLIESDLVDSKNPKELEELFFQQLQIVPQFSGLFYGDEAGNFVYVMRGDHRPEFRTKIITRDGGKITTRLIWRNEHFNIVEESIDPDDRFDPRTRPWYIEAKNDLDFVWTEPYLFFSSQRPGITAAIPVTDPATRLKGVIGIDIEIEQIAAFLSDLEIGKNGVAMALSESGEVIAHPNRELIKVADADGNLEFANIQDIEDPVARAAFGKLSLQNTGSEPGGMRNEFDYDGNTYASLLIPSLDQSLPLAIAIYVPLEDFIGGIRENRTRNIWIAILIALVTGVLGLKIADRINRPVRDFAASAELVSSGNLSASDVNLQTYPELEEVGETLVSEMTQRKASQREYGLTFELASRGMAQISPDDGKFLRVNSQLTDILGYSAGEMMQMTFSDILHPDDADTYISFKHTVYDDYEYNQEKRYVRKDGKIIWLGVNAMLIRDQEGEPMYAVATIDDRTAAKDAENKINKLNSDLSHYARVNTLGQMATGLAHELNQPLTALTQNVDAALVTLKQRAESDPELEEILNDMDRQAHHGAEIIRALRDLVRKDEGSKVSFNLSELIDQMLQLLAHETTEKDVLITSKANKKINVLANRVQIAQVIMNLLHNAMEAMSDGDITAKRIKIETQLSGDKLEVSIADMGPGIDPNVNLFTQFESSKTEGMGMGLALCKTLIEANGGKIWYDREGASRFRFTIPTS